MELIGSEFQFCKKMVVEMATDSGRTVFWIYSILLEYTLRMVKMVFIRKEKDES